MGGALSELTTAATAAEVDERPVGGERGEAVVTIDHVWKQFGAFTAVEDANFEIARGEFFAMLGPSGCGKTTTLRMIAGFEQPTRGRVLLDGRDVSRVPAYRRPVNTVFQQYALFPHMTVFDNVAFGPRSRKVGDTEVRRSVGEILEVVRLGDLAKRKPAQLSGGQQQRVALARALVNLPRALLLDEPLGALDLKLRQAMQLELKRIQRETAITFIFVTHDQEEALTMSDRIAVMSAGRVEQIGTPVDIYHHPETTFVAGFIGEANLLAATIQSAAGDEAVVTLAGAGRAPAPTRGRAFEVGRTVTLMVRPERLEVSVAEPADPALPRVRTTIVDLVFQGPVVRFDLRAPDGRPLVAKVGAEARLPLLRPGDELWASWVPEASYLVPDEPPAARDLLTEEETPEAVAADT